MKNFGSACEISLFNPLEFIPSSRENDIAQVATARVDNHTGPFYGIFQNFGRQVLAFLTNILLKGFKSLRLVDVNPRLQKPHKKKSGKVKSDDLAGQRKSSKREIKRPKNASVKEISLL